MLELDWRVDARGGIVLVELVVANPTATARRVRVADRLDGPVWPPRREGVPEAGWDDGGFEGVVAPGERRPLGYASPVSGDGADASDTSDDTADLADPPAELVWSERAGESERAAGPGNPDALTDDDAITDEATPEGVVRALGDGRPPADAVPSPGVGSKSDLEDADAPNRRSP
jgi:hypothetical protein